MTSTHIFTSLSERNLSRISSTCGKSFSKQINITSRISIGCTLTCQSRKMIMTVECLQQRQWRTLDLRKIFSQDDIQHIRIQYMNQLFFWKKNTADKRLVTCSNIQGDFANNLP